MGIVKQKFRNGDHIRMDKDPTGRGKEGIVIGSYQDLYGGTPTLYGDGKRHFQYSIHIKGRGSVSWYDENVLILIARGQHDLWDEWKASEAAVAAQKSDLDWIFKNGKSILRSATGPSIEALAKCLGVSNLWGSHGEGFEYLINAHKVLDLARPFLEANDRSGWEKFSAQRNRQ